MENKTKYPTYTFMHAKSRMEEFYPVKMSENSFIEKAFITWEDLPDRHTNAHVYIGKVDFENKIEIPENVEYIKAVTTPSYIKHNIFGLNYHYYDRGSVFFDIYFDNIDWDSYRIDKSLQDRYGVNITYKLLDNNTITFPQGDFENEYIAILYKGLIVDERCEPLLFKNEINAIASRIAYTDARFDVLKGDPSKANMISLLKQESEIAMAKAGIAEKVSDNQIDQMLNIAASFDRKVYNRNYKFRR